MTETSSVHEDKFFYYVELHNSMTINQACCKYRTHLFQKLSLTCTLYVITMMVMLSVTQSQVSQKEQLAEKYQRLLQEARNELHTTTDAHKTEVASLTAKLHSQADSALSRLKQAALEAVNPPQPPHLTDAQLDRLRELEELTEEQEKAITQLRRQGQQVKHEMEQDKQVSKTRLTRLQQELSDTKTQHEKEVSG